MASEYGKWTIKQLKDELRRRHAKTAGRKSELASRLQHYDDNFNFVSEEATQNDNAQYVMLLPDINTYKDVNSSSIVPTLTKNDIDQYLSLSNQKSQCKGENLYKEKYLLCLRSSKANTDNVFVKTRCAAEMKKSIIYTIDVKLSMHGVIEEAQCECGAGMGPTAHCKHIVASLYALLDFSNEKDILLNESCTSKLQTFHHVKKFKGSPLKAHQLQLRDVIATPMATLSSFDPRPESFRNQSNYQTSFQNNCIAFSASRHSRMPILHLFPPANLYAFHNDHSYHSSSPEKDLLRQLNVEDMSEECRADIEEKTRGQSKNPEWMRQRSTRICSSSFGKICKATVKTNFHCLAIALANPGDQVYSDSINHGRKYENKAAALYESTTGQATEECGLCVSPSHPFMASSPDRMVNETTVLEIKCPWVARFKAISPETVDYIYLNDRDGQYCLKKTHVYYYQVQGQLFCASRDVCHFMIWTFVDSLVIVVERDDEFITNMTNIIANFYNKYFRQVLLDKYLYHNYSKHF